MDNAVQALGEYYFKPNALPITVKVAETLPDGEEAHPHDFTEVPHYHDFCELAFVVEGQATHHLEGDDFPISTGDVFVIQGQQVHWFSERKGLKLVNVMFDPERLMLPDSELRKIPGYSAIFLLEPNLRKSHRFSSKLHLDGTALLKALSYTEEMMGEDSREQPGYEASLMSQLIELIVFVSRQYENSERTEAKALFQVGSIIGAMESDPTRNWSIEDLAHVAHLSRSHLFRLFKLATGQSPIDYLTHIRMQRAMSLLKRSEKSITEIAYDIGFSDSNYFTRQFSKLIGLSPSAFRRS